MGGRLWFLGHTYFSYTCTGSALDVMDYGLSEAESSEQNLMLGRRLCHPHLQVILLTVEQHMFFFFLYGRRPSF